MAANPTDRLRAIVADYRQASKEYANSQDAAAKRHEDQEERNAARIKTLTDSYNTARTNRQNDVREVDSVVSDLRDLLRDIHLESLVGTASGLPSHAPSLASAESAFASARQERSAVVPLVRKVEDAEHIRSRKRPPGVISIAVISLSLAALVVVGFISASNSGEAYSAFSILLSMIDVPLLTLAGIGVLTKQRPGYWLAFWACAVIVIVPWTMFWLPNEDMVFGIFFFGTFYLFAMIYLVRPGVRRAFAPSVAATKLAIQNHVGRFNGLIASARGWYNQALASEERDYQAKLAAQQHLNTTDLSDVDFKNRNALDLAAQTYNRKLSDARTQIIALDRDLGLDAADWPDAAWRAWAPATTGAIPLARVGTVTEVSGRAATSHEALLQGTPPQPRFPIPMGERLLIEAAGAPKRDITAAVQSLMARLLATLPPGKLLFTLIDPIGIGQNVAGFMRLGDFDDRLVNGMAWTDPDKIEQRLAGLAEHMRNVIQRDLRDQFPTIVEYNAQAVVPEAYQVLVVFDFPANFTESAARNLVSIMANGPRCGVYPIVVADSTRPKPYGFELGDLRQNAPTLLTWNSSRWVWSDDTFKECAIALDTPPHPELLRRIIETVGQAAVDADVVQVPFANYAPQAADWWQGDSTDGIAVPLGPRGANKVQALELGKDTEHHVLVVGQIGSGKSTLLHTTILETALLYSPDAVELYLIDLKEGVEFKPYAEHHLPNARVIAIESEREFALSVLQGLERELQRRGDLFRDNHVPGIGEYRRQAGRSLPRILLIVDEFQRLFEEDDAIAVQSEQVLDRLVKQGRGFGIHVLLSSQTLAGTHTLARSTMDQMAVRIALECSDADSRLILAEDNPAARLLSRPGEAIYNTDKGLVEYNQRFQVAISTPEEREQYLIALSQMGTPHDQIVFEGNAQIEVANNTRLAAALAAPTWPVAPAPRAWLGDPVAIRDEPVAATFRRQSGNNLLIVGQQPDTARAMLQIALLSLAAEQAPTPLAPDKPGAFYVLDFTALDDPQADAFVRLAGDLPHDVRVARRRDLPYALGEITAEIQRRLGADERTSSSPIYLLLYGLHQARDLRPDDSMRMPAYGEPPPPPGPAEQFMTILREGPEVGIHSLVWCDSVPNLDRALDHRGLREFAMRIVFQMAPDDSSRLIDTPQASKLGTNRAFYYSEDEGRLEKFRPYAPPTDAWLRAAGDRLKRKGP